MESGTSQAQQWHPSADLASGDRQWPELPDLLQQRWAQWVNQSWKAVHKGGLPRVLQAQHQGEVSALWGTVVQVFIQAEQWVVDQYAANSAGEAAAEVEQFLATPLAGLRLRTALGAVWGQGPRVRGGQINAYDIAYTLDRNPLQVRVIRLGGGTEVVAVERGVRLLAVVAAAPQGSMLAHAWQRQQRTPITATARWAPRRHNATQSGPKRAFGPQ